MAPLSYLMYPVWKIWKQSARLAMAKKKSSPKKKPAPKKTYNKKCGRESCENNKPAETNNSEFELKPLTKADYFFGMIKRAFGYE